MALLVAALEEEDPGHQALLGGQRRLPGRVGERREVLGDGLLGHAEAGEQRRQPVAALVRELGPRAGVRGEVDGRRIPLQAGHDPGEEVGPEAALREHEVPAHDALPELPLSHDIHGSKRAGRSACPRSCRVRAAPPRARVAPADHPRLEARALEHRRQVLVDAPGRSAASSATLRRASGSPRAGHSANRPSTSLTSTRRPAPTRPATHAAIESEVTVPRRGQRVERQRGGQEHGRSSGADAREVGAALGARDQLAQQPAELLHAEDRHAVRGRRAQPEAAVGVAHGVGEAGAAGHDEQRMALAELAERRAQRPQRVVARRARRRP